MNLQQSPQAASASPESSFPAIDIVRREERIEYECAVGQTCQLRADNCTTISADSGVMNGTPTQEHGDGRVPCTSRHSANIQVTNPQKAVPENGKRVQLTPNVALKIVRDAEGNSATAFQGDNKKEVEIKITEQVIIAMKNDDKRMENSVESQTPSIVAEARSEVKHQAHNFSILAVPKDNVKSHSKKTRRSHPPTANEISWDFVLQNT
ncbi:hypothetical protein MRX96_058450 [Rhipicephalus microplus]